MWAHMSETGNVVDVKKAKVQEQAKLKGSDSYRVGCQADVTAPPLASFALIMAAEAVETSATTNFPPEVSTS